MSFTGVRAVPMAGPRSAGPSQRRKFQAEVDVKSLGGFDGSTCWSVGVRGVSVGMRACSSPAAFCSMFPKL